MRNSERARLAMEAWREHLITKREAMEIVGGETELDLLTVGSGQQRPSSGGRGDSRETDQRSSRRAA